MSNLRLPCPDCNDRASVQIFRDGSFCYACRKQSKYKTMVKVVSKKTPKILQDLSFDIPESGMKWLRKYRITDENIKRFKIGWSDEFQRIVFPYYYHDGHLNKLQYSWMRDPTGLRTPKWLYVKSGMDLPYYVQKKGLDDRSNAGIIITEDVVSAIRCSSNNDVMALGSLNFNKEHITKILLRYQKIIIWLDGDKAGRDASRRFCKKWGLLRKVIEIKTKADPKCYSDRQIEEILHERN